MIRMSYSTGPQSNQTVTTVPWHGGNLPVCFWSEPDMWYSTVTEIQQTIPPSDPKTEQQVDSLPEQTAMATGSEKAATAPGSEYWLP